MVADNTNFRIPPLHEEEGSLSTLSKMHLNSLDVKEFNLKEINGKPINSNINASWEIIKGAYCIALEKDPKWHYFYEDTYNIIRCSIKFADNLKKYLEDCGVKYSESYWSDDQYTTKKYQHIFCPMFHTFSMMGINGFETWEISGLFDRVAHCFLNHQFPLLCSRRGSLNKLWESQIVANYLIGRTHHTGYLDCNTKTKEEEGNKGWLERCLIKRRKKKERKKNLALRANQN